MRSLPFLLPLSQTSFVSWGSSRNRRRRKLGSGCYSLAIFVDQRPQIFPGFSYTKIFISKRLHRVGSFSSANLVVSRLDEDTHLLRSRLHSRLCAHSVLGRTQR